MSDSDSFRALVVDDFADSAEALKMLLDQAGWSTEIARDGIEALRIANASHPRLIFLDISMPKLDGFDTCGVIRAQPWAADTRLVAVTGLPVEDIRDRAQAVGFNAYLLKPVEPEELLRVAGEPS